MKNELTWLETEYIRNDITVQPVLVNDKLWYTAFDSHGYSLLFETILDLFKWLGGNFSGACNAECFGTEKEMIEYLEEVQ